MDLFLYVWEPGWPADGFELCEHVFCFCKVGFGGFEAGVHHRRVQAEFAGDPVG